MMTNSVTLRFNNILCNWPGAGPASSSETSEFDIPGAQNGDTLVANVVGLLPTAEVVLATGRVSNTGKGVIMFANISPVNPHGPFINQPINVVVHKATGSI